MKVTVDEQKKTSADEYPKLMNNDGIIVLFNAHSVGVVVSNNGIYPLGRFLEDWQMENFTDFHGTITLEND